MRFYHVKKIAIEISGFRYPRKLKEMNNFSSERILLWDILVILY